MPVIGFMSARSPEDTVEVLKAFHNGLEQSGFIDGRNVKIEYRWARGRTTKETPTERSRPT
jgi:putative ABC transport system substrate-binding protein